MELTDQEIDNILNECSDRFDPVELPVIVSQSRWHTRRKQVFRCRADGTFWEFTWNRGSTEKQDEGPENISWREVIRTNKVITVYEPKE